MIEQNYTGLACPEPVIRCKNFINEKQERQFAVFVDNRAAVENVERLLKKNGYVVNIFQESENKWRLEALREDTSDANIMNTTHSTKQAQEIQNSVVLHAKSKKLEEETPFKTLILVPTDFFGSGDDVLGEKLMENFLATLPELGENLWKLVLVNGGVRLSAKEGKALNTLKELDRLGVEILVCGACLEFYGLTQEKQIGETTNMLDIVTSIDLADKVVRV